MTLTESPALYVIDASAEDRATIMTLAFEFGITCYPFETVTSFLGAHDYRRPACLVFDFVGQGVQGLDLHQTMTRQFEVPLPMIVTSSAGDLDTAMQFIRAGAENYLVKPLRYSEIRDAIYRSVARDRNRIFWHDRKQNLDEKMNRITQRERSILERVVAGETNQTIADAFGLSPRTIESTRARIYRKLDISSTAELAATYKEHALLQVFVETIPNPIPDGIRS